MKLKLAIIAQLLLIHSIVINSYANDQEKNTPVSLFNGKDLSGWTSVGSAKWEVIDGIIKGGQNGNPSKSGVSIAVRSFPNCEPSWWSSPGWSPL